MPDLGARRPLDDLAGVGIAGMQARLRSVGGNLRIENRNPGLRVLAFTPFHRPSSAAA